MCYVPFSLQYLVSHGNGPEHHEQHRDTIVAVLPVRTDITSGESNSENAQELLSDLMEVSKFLLIENLLFSGNDKLQLLADAASVGMLLHSSDQIPLQMNIALGSYVCDKPKPKDLIEVKRGNETNFQCYNCLLFKYDITKYKIWCSCILEHAVRLTEMYNHNENEEKAMKYLSILSNSFCPKFSTAKVPPTLDVYRTLLWEPMQDLSNGGFTAF